MFSMMKIITNIILTLLLALFVSCDNGGDCKINNVSYYRVKFYSINSETGLEQNTQFPDQISVSLVVNGTDSTVVNHVTDATDLALPMSYTNSCDTVLIEFGSIEIDTLFVNHTNIPYFISMDCGMGMYHDITSVEKSGSLIDSVAVVYSHINFDRNENLKVYIAE